MAQHNVLAPVDPAHAALFEEGVEFVLPLQQHALEFGAGAQCVGPERQGTGGAPLVRVQATFLA